MNAKNVTDHVKKHRFLRATCFFVFCSHGLWTKIMLNHAEWLGISMANPSWPSLCGVAVPKATDSCWELGDPGVGSWGLPRVNCCSAGGMIGMFLQHTMGRADFFQDLRSGQHDSRQPFYTLRLVSKRIHFFTTLCKIADKPPKWEEKRR